MRYSYVRLERLLARDPEAYRKEIERLRDEDPDVLDGFVDHVASKVNEERREKHVRLRRISSVRRFVVGST